MNYIFSIKALILLFYTSSTLFIHLRGKVKHAFFRQLTDHSTLFAPVNALMYLSSSVPPKPYLQLSDFPGLAILQNNWHLIRDEAKNLLAENQIRASNIHDDVGFNSFYRRGWKRFYLKWYNDPPPSAQNMCPQTIALLKQCSEIKAAMFALLPSDSELMKHRDPYAGSLRYHLGLITPNSDLCRIVVDGETYSWKDGEAILFDETYIHYVINESPENRLILFCDVERPLNNKFARIINKIFSLTIMAAFASVNTS